MRLVWVNNSKPFNFFIIVRVVQRCSKFKSLFWKNKTPHPKTVVCLLARVCVVFFFCRNRFLIISIEFLFISLVWLVALFSFIRTRKLCLECLSELEIQINAIENVYYDARSKFFLVHLSSENSTKIEVVFIIIVVTFVFLPINHVPS